MTFALKHFDVACLHLINFHRLNLEVLEDEVPFYRGTIREWRLMRPVFND